MNTYLIQVGDSVEIDKNQAMRETDIIAVTDTEALGVYGIPAGRYFLAVLDRSTGDWIRSQPLKTLPKKWGTFSHG